MRFLAMSFCFAVLPAVAVAHHSRSEFSDEISELRGEIVELFWANPHPHVAINVVDPDGTLTLWRVEMWTNLFGTERAGVTRELFNEGDTLIVAGQVSGRRDGYMLGNNLLFADGREAVLNVDSGPRWTSRLLNAASSTANEEAQLARAASENRGIFRVWTPIDFYQAYSRSYPYTEAALAGQAEWNELDNFLTRCEQPGMPRTMMTPQEYEFVESGNTILVRAQFFDTTRTVYMQETAEPNGQPPSHLGYSIGHWEGPTLVVETNRINWPYFDTSGTPQSEAVHVTERYTLSEDQGRLNLQMMITDPLAFTEPAVYEVTWAALGRTLREYNCQIYGDQ